MAEHDDSGEDDAPDLEPTGVVVDHRILDLIVPWLQTMPGWRATRESECIEFRDPDTGQCFEIVVRAIDPE